MSEPAVQDSPVQHTIEMPNGVVLSGSGGDAEAIREQLEERHEERHEERTGQPVPVAAEPAAPSQGESNAKRRRVAQERIDEAIGKQRDAERRAEAAEAKARDYESRMSAPQSKAEPAATPATAERTKPSEDEVGTKYATYGDYIEDLADWKAEQKISSYDATLRGRIESEQASRSFHDSANAMVERGRKAFPDFDAVRMNQDGGGFVPLGPTPEIDALKKQLILSHPHSEQIVYEVCKSKPLAMELAGIQTPFEFGMRLAQLVATPAPAADAAPAKAVVPMTHAAPPMQPVGTSSRTTVPSLSELASSSDYDNSGYRERRAAERKANGR